MIRIDLFKKWLISATLLLQFSPHDSFSANCVFNGLGDGTSWTDAANWSCGAQPNTSFDNITIPVGFNVINDAGLDIDLDNGNSLTLEGTLDMQNGKISASQPGSVFTMTGMSQLTNCSELMVVNNGTAIIDFGAEVTVTHLKVDDLGVLVLNSCAFNVLHSMEVLAAGGVSGGGQITYLGAVGNYVNTSTVGIFGCVDPVYGGCDLGTCLILAVEMGSFEVYVKRQGEVTIAWSTLAETDNDYFTIERSADLVHWETVATESGAGNSYSELHYEVADQPTGGGIYYYRIRSTDFMGEQTVTSPRSVSIEPIQRMYPNPANNVVYIELDSGTIQSLSIVSLDGKIIPETNFDVTQLGKTMRLDVSNIETGIYTLHVDETVLYRLYISH